MLSQAWSDPCCPCLEIPWKQPGSAGSAGSHAKVWYAKGKCVNGAAAQRLRRYVGT